ncbi:unnamed protein product, partial [Meganyctiphanes norvegica]
RDGGPSGSTLYKNGIANVLPSNSTRNEILIIFDTDETIFEFEINWERKKVCGDEYKGNSGTLTFVGEELPDELYCRWILETLPGTVIYVNITSIHTHYYDHFLIR